MGGKRQPGAKRNRRDSGFCSQGDRRAPGGLALVCIFRELLAWDSRSNRMEYARKTLVSVARCRQLGPGWRWWKCEKQWEPELFQSGVVGSSVTRT